MKKVLAINGSPRGKKSNTDRILQPFLQGAAAAGAECETIYAIDLEVQDCMGCFACWEKTPGVCAFPDDMEGLLIKIRNADMIIWATPLYYFGMNGRLRRIIERMLPLNQPYMVNAGDHFTHLPRFDKMPGQIVLIANCGFPDRGQFDALVHTFNKIARPQGLAGSILCPAGELLGVKELQGQFDWYTDAARQAGREMVEVGRISDHTASILEKPLVPIEVFVSSANASWHVEGEKPPSLEEALYGSQTSDRPQGLQGTAMMAPTGDGTFKDLIAGMASSFRADIAGELQAVYQFDVTGVEPGQYYLQIENGQCAAYEGSHPSPSITIHTPSDVWMAISRGEISGQDAMMKGKYLVEGDFSLLIQMDKIFNSDNQDTKRRKGTKKSLTILKMVFNQNFIVSAIIPLVIFYVFDHWGMTLPGIIASGSWSVGVVLVGFAREHKANSLALLAGIMSAIGLLGTTISRNPLLYLASPIIIDLVFAVIFLGSLFLRRPLVQIIVEDTWQDFPAIFKSSPKYQKPWKILTMGWGFLNIFQAVLCTVLLLTVSTVVYYSISTIVSTTSSIMLMIFSVWFPGWYWGRTGLKRAARKV